VNFLCPSCRTPLPAPGANQNADCTKCGVRVDLTGIETAPGQAKLWPEVDLAHEKLGPFSLVSTLGAGGMGAVYAATSPTGIGVAVKVLAPMLAAEPGLRERFRREAHALRAIDHPGVVRILDEGEDRGFSWYAMEKIDGRDLREVLRTKRMTAPEAEALARALLDALAAVHAAGLVHRDIKPGNILLAPSGPKLCDFGIARFDGQATLTESAAIMGSLRYMAPEQRWGKSGPLSDLYGVGVVLHEALYGGVPGEVAPSGDVPAWLAEFVQQLTAQRAEDRPATARAALKRLDRLKNRWKVRAGMAAAVVAALAAPAVWWNLPTATVPPQPPPVVAAPVVIDAGLALAEPVDAGPPPDPRNAHDFALLGEKVATSRPETALALLRAMTTERSAPMTDDDKRALLGAVGIPALANVSGSMLDAAFRRMVSEVQAPPTKGINLGSKSEVPAPRRRGKLTASSVPSDAEIWIDGKNSGVRSPGELDLPEGKHAVVFKRDGRASLPRIVIITPDAAYALQDVAIPEDNLAPPTKKPTKGKSKKPMKVVEEPPTKG
jgi:serine/threonine-protein kinase